MRVHLVILGKIERSGVGTPLGGCQTSGLGTNKIQEFDKIKVFVDRKEGQQRRRICLLCDTKGVLYC